MMKPVAALAAAALSLLASPVCLAMGDFPFFCKSDQVDVKEFTIDRDANSPTGFTVWYTTRLGTVDTVPVDVERDDGVYYVNGSVAEDLAFTRGFIGSLPVACGEACESRANIYVVPFGTDIAATPLTRAYCAAGR